MNRLIIENIEGRITLGIVMFVSIMILIGWVAINEPARMAAFTEQQNGRAIERGAQLFAANCSSCHGLNGYGGGLGPALNSPHFFGYDFMASVNEEIIRYQREEEELVNVVTELERQKEEALTSFNALSAEQQAAAAGTDLLILIGDIDARLVDNTDGVAARLAGIESGTLATEESNPALSDAQLAARQTALSTNIPNRQREINIALNGDGGENVGLLAQRQQILDSFGSAVSRGYLPRLEVMQSQLEAGSLTPLGFSNYLTDEANRLRQISWGGTQEGYILTTLIHGRPGSNNVWPQPMSSWSQRGGGPLRDDQIRDIIAYIMNWDKGANWTMADLNNVQQFARLHAAYTPPQDGDGTTTTGGDGRELGPEDCTGMADCVAGVGTIAEISANLPQGDANNGSALYSSLGCAGCHLGGAVGPDVVGTWARAEGERLQDPANANFSATEYLVMSILHPNYYVPSPYSPGIMPQNFGQLLNHQQLADIIAYLQSQ